MTDRELLELAAKAAGYEWGWFGANFNVRRPDGLWVQWNPLTDDGDALRLALTLRINIEHQTTMGGRPVGFSVYPSGRGDCLAQEDGNSSASLRRAIVRAAAEIGRGME